MNSRKPSKYFWLVLGFWTILGIIMGTTYLAKYPPPDTIINFYMKGYIIALIIAYFNAIQFPFISILYKVFKKNKTKLFFTIPVYTMFCLFSCVIIWFIRSIYSTAVFYDKSIDWYAMLESFRFFKILSYDGIFCFILNLLIIYTKEYYDLFKEGQIKAAQLEVELVKSQLEALKIQIHPHFLFNTLHLIASLIREKDNNLVLKMTTSLSNFLRYTLNYHSRDFVTFEQEMEMIFLYLEIQQIRFSDRKKVNYNIAQDAKNSKIPNMILQPLVENAIRHCFGNRIFQDI